MHNVRKKYMINFRGCAFPQTSWRPRHLCSLCPTHFLVPSGAYADRGLFSTCASVLVAAVGCLDHVKIMTD